MSTTTFISGAGRGLGLEFTRQCLARGDTVVAAVRTPSRAEELTALSEGAGGRLHVVALDVSDPASIDACGEATAALVDHLDVLINNAGINSMSAGIPEEQRNVRLGSLEPEGILSMVRVNAVGPVLLTQRLLGLLEQGTAPRVVHISSWLGSMTVKQSGGNYGYCASKACLNMLGRALAFDLKGRGVTSAMFNPGWVKTDMGGPSAPTPVDVSVRGLLAVIDGASPEVTGRFFDHDGKSLPW